MKKLLLTTLCVASSTVAMAQSSVTIFGVADLGFRYIDNGATSLKQLASGGMVPSRLGFRGVEDLGGGLSASFWLEAALSLDTGLGQPGNPNNSLTVAPASAGTQPIAFNRRSTVSLAGAWGEIRLGRDVLPQYWNLLIFDPFFNSGVGGTQLFNGIPTGQVVARASNSIGYFLPADLGGFYGQVIYYMGENLSGTPLRDDGNGAGTRLGYANGPLDIAAAIGRTKFAAGDARQSNLAASWNFDTFKLMGMISRDGLGPLKGKGASVGVTVPIGPGEVKLSYSTYQTSLALKPEASKVAVGYVHNLSKRTAIYTTIAYLKNKNGSTSSVALGAGAPGSANRDSRGFDLGIRHNF